jgi:S-adenosylhomocysteine hydrolase
LAGRSISGLEPPKLPLLDSLSGLVDKVDFSNTVLVGVQHLQASNASMLVKLHEAGLDYGRMFLLGKVYSSNPLVAEILKRLGVFVHQGSFELDDVGLLENYRKQLDKEAADLLVIANERLLSQPKPRKLLVVDSGASLVTLVNRYRESIEAGAVAVEQTTSGVRRIEELTCVLLPIIDVAGSQAKRRHESRYIASSIIENLESRIRALPVETQLADSEVLVVGIGAVGMEVAKQLRNKVANLVVYDLNGERLAMARKDGLHVVGLQNGLSRSQIIIGCVGKYWLPENAERLIQDGAILASGSSSNVEFLGLNVLNQHDAAGLELAHLDYLVKVQNGIAWVLNAGFPVDFDGSPDPIPPEVIQFTRALMLAGIYQAMGSNQADRGLIGLDDSLQGLLTGAARKFNAI